MIDLPAVATARLPDVYKAARYALVACTEVDECKEWADKAQALASYAKQAGDSSLERMAVRIKARAIRQCGVLLRAVTPQPGKRTDLGPAPGLGFPTRTEVAEAAGISRRQRKTALAVAAVPEPAFESAVDGFKPATVTELAEAGAQRIVRAGQRPGFSEATKALGLLRRFAEFTADADGVTAAGGLAYHELDSADAEAHAIQLWLKTFRRRITDRKEVKRGVSNTGS